MGDGPPGQVTLPDGRTVVGFTCEAAALQGAPDITVFRVLAGLPGRLLTVAGMRDDAQDDGGSQATAMVIGVDPWGVAGSQNEAAGDWFLLVEEETDPGAVMAAALDDALGAPDELEVDPACETIAVAELCASCAGQAPERLPDRVEDWVQTNPHGPHADEIALAVEAVGRVREESELRRFWERANEHDRWLAEVDDLLARLRRSSAGAPPAVSP